MSGNISATQGFLGRIIRRLMGGSDNHPSLTAGACPSRRPFAIPSHVRASAHDGGLALLNIATGRVFLCNQTGARIWQALQTGLSPDVISSEFSRDYGISREVAEQHVATFLSEMESHGIIEPVDGSC